jgi:hypothetical protein
MDNKEDNTDDFWGSKSVSSTLKDKTYEYDTYIYSKNIEYDVTKIILPNLGYLNEDKSFYFRFNDNNIREIDGFMMPKIVNIRLSSYYDFQIDNTFFNVTPMKYEYYGGLVIQVKYLKSKNISNESLLALYAKKIELYLLNLPTEDEVYIRLGIKNKSKIEDSGAFFTINRNKNRANNTKYDIDSLIDNSDSI